MTDTPECDGCWTGRKPRFRIDYDCMRICWVCWLRMTFPWTVSIIDWFDMDGATNPEDPKTKGSPK